MACRPRSVRTVGVGIGAVADQLAGSMEDRAGQQLRARVAFVQDHARQPRHVQRAQHEHRDSDDRGDAGDLLPADAQSHRDSLH